MIVDEFDKPYLAACTDCDGCIQITRRQRRKVSTIQYNLDVTVVSNTSVPLLNFVEGCIPDAGWKEDDRPFRKGKTLYSFCLTGSKAVEYLQDILPYLKGKKLQAELGIAFHQFKNGKQGVKLSKEKTRVLQSMYEKMRRLKIEEPKGGASL